MLGNVDERIEIQLQYTYKHPLMTIASAFLRKYNWESKLQLSTIAHAEQLDADRVLMYRRHENNMQEGVGWEKIILDRNSGVVSENVVMKPCGSTYVFEKSVMSPSGSNTVLDQFVYNAAGNKTGQVEIFKKSIERELSRLLSLMSSSLVVPMYINQKHQLLKML